jgi:DNA-binding beta-propeller fold protein YncE
MDVLDAKLVAFIPAGRDPEGIALSSIEDKIFVSNQGDGTITMIEKATHTILREIDLGEVYPGDLIADAGRIYALNFTSNTISVLDETTGDPIGTIEGL